MVTSVMIKSNVLMDKKWFLAFPSPSSSKYPRAVTTTVNADLNLCRAFVRLDHLVSQSDCIFFTSFMPACASLSSSSSARKTRNLLAE